MVKKKRLKTGEPKDGYLEDENGEHIRPVPVLYPLLEETEFPNPNCDDTPEYGQWPEED